MSQTCVTPKSARKRIIFSKSPLDEGSSDSTLGHMSPLSSSPDRYSSPPPSPQWLTETPTKFDPSLLHQSPFCSGHSEVKTPKSNKHKHSRIFGSSVSNPLQPKATPQKHFQVNATPQKRNNKNEKKSLEMELVEESPSKDSSLTGLITPFKCLAGKENNVERTPKLKTKKLIVGESPEISSLAAPVKLLNKFRAVNVEPTPEIKLVQANSDPVKLHSLPTSTFYSSRARAALFPEQISHPSKSFPSILDKKRKRTQSAESLHFHRRLPVVQIKSQIKRRKLGEINVGVGHRIKKFKKTIKKPVKDYAAYAAQPKTTPADRIISYIEKTYPSLLDSLNNDADTSIQQEITNSINNENSETEKEPDPVERVSSPPPDHTKKFFKTKRTLKINTTATVTVDKNIKINVSNGKYFLKKTEGKVKTIKNEKQTSSKTDQKITFEPFGDEKSKAEVVQESVHDNVEMLLEKLVESPVKDEGSLLSPNHHITALASSTSSLVINDDAVIQPDLQNQYISGKEIVQVLSTPPKGNVLDELPERVNKFGKKYYPLFYKNSPAKKFKDNVKSPRGTKRPWKSVGSDQYIIDAGQKKFGATQCKECGIIYQIGDPDDEITHEKFHDNDHYLKYSVLKNERIVAYYGSDKVVLIKSSDSKSWLNRVKCVLTLVDKELGYSEAGIWNYDHTQVYLYVTHIQIAGCVVVHGIQEAHKMLNSVIEGCDCCSEETYPAKCGISRIWVNDMHRRKKIATKLLDSIRSCFIQGYLIGKDEIAFSAPTISGKAFAEKYTGTESYLVYT